MIIVPETPITEASFTKWKCHRIDATDEIEGNYHYFIIPLVELNEDEIQQLEYMPTLFSSASDEFTDEDGVATYTMQLFEEDLPELTTEEEVEILYKILTKKELFLK
jgi:hypothetical protein